MSSAQDEPRDAGLAGALQAHRAELLRFMTARCGSADEAEDLLQDLWVRVRTQTTGPVGNPRAYLFRMANNIVLDRVRADHRAMRRQRRWLDDGQDGGGPAPDDRADLAEAVDDSIAREQEAAILQTAIAALPDGAARALRLYRFEEMGQGEIAQRLGISRSGVEKHLALAMKHLRAALVNCGSFATVASNVHGADAEAKPHTGQER